MCVYECMHICMYICLLCVYLDVRKFWWGKILLNGLRMQLQLKGSNWQVKHLMSGILFTQFSHAKFSYIQHFIGHNRIFDSPLKENMKASLFTSLVIANRLIASSYTNGNGLWPGQLLFTSLLPCTLQFCPFQQALLQKSLLYQTFQPFNNDKAIHDKFQIIFT